MAETASMEITECVYHTELSVLQVFMTTYENFDNCVKSTQKAFEKLYHEINTKLDNLKVNLNFFKKNHIIIPLLISNFFQS